jgi:excisionase family DNA binding protein
MSETRTNYPALASLEGKLTVSPDEVAEVLGIGRSAVYEAIHRGQLPSRRLGRRLLIPVPLLLDWLGVDSSRPPYSPSAHTCRRAR